MKKYIRKTLSKITGLLLSLVFVSGTVAESELYRVYAEEETTEISTTAAEEDSFNETLEKFPESYRPYLSELHEKHPNWTFEPFNTGLEWGTVLKNEAVLKRKLVPAKGSGMSLGLADFKDDGVTWAWYPTPTAWKAYDEINGAFNYENNDWVAFDTGSWNQASKAAISYVMDPRNWLNENYIFMYEQLGFNETHDTVEIINSALQGTFMYNANCPGSDNQTYAQVILDAAKNAGVSAMHLAIRLVQEKGTSNDKLGKGVSTQDGTNFYQANGDGNTVYYNFFNIGACGNGETAVINAGGKEAMDAGWTSPYLAIMGGAVKVNNGYIAIGQDTIYFEMFSVVNPKYYYWKQYAQNLTATLTEGSKINTTYKKARVFDAAFVFRIPIYENMPESACPYPLAPDGNKYNTSNPNAMLSGIDAWTAVAEGSEWTKVNLTPTFNMNTTSYSIVVPYHIQKFYLEAKTYASTTTVSGTGDLSLSVGNNEFKLTAKSEYGTERTYTVNVYRSEGSTLLTELTPSVSQLNETFNKDNFTYTMYANNDISTVTFSFKTDSDIAVVKLRQDDISIALPEGCTPEITLGEDDTEVYLDVYASEGDDENYSTYVIKIVRYVEIELDTGDLVVKDGTISNFVVGDTVENALAKLNVKNGTVVIQNSKGETKDSQAIIATGDIIKIYDINSDEKYSYEIIIYGDVNGDGKIDIYDFGFVRKMIIKNTGLSGIYYQAGDIYQESDGIDIYDFGVIRRYIIKGTPIAQKR